MLLFLTTYRRKQINAYLAPAVNGKPDTTRCIFGRPVAGQEHLAYRGKRHEVEIDLSRVPDGLYIYKEAGGADLNKTRYGWISVEGGEIVEEGLGMPKTSK